MTSVDPLPHRVAETINRLDATASAPLNAYWLSVVGDRRDYAARLQPLLGERGLGVLIVRSTGFTNPNALMADLVDLLERNRTEFLDIVARRRPDTERIGIVLLSRRELAMGQAYSPVTWPEWIPGVGSRESTCFITDVSRRIEVPLDAPEVDAGRVQSALFAVEEALVRRLVLVQRRSPHVQAGLFDNVRRRSDVGGWPGFLARAQRAARAVTDPRSYRPEVRDGDAVVARLWGLCRERPPAGLVGVRAELAAALAVTDDLVATDPREGLTTVLARNPERRLSPSEWLCANIIATVPAACQFVTAVKHAGDYQCFPVNLLTAFVDDLYQTLVSLETALIHLSDDDRR